MLKLRVKKIYGPKVVYYSKLQYSNWKKIYKCIFLSNPLASLGIYGTSVKL